MESSVIQVLFTHSKAIRLRAVRAVINVIQTLSFAGIEREANAPLTVGVMHGSDGLLWAHSLQLKLGGKAVVENLNDLSKSYDVVVVPDGAFGFIDLEQNSVQELVAVLTRSSPYVLIMGTLPFDVPAKDSENDSLEWTSWVRSHRHGSYANYYLQALNGPVTREVKHEGGAYRFAGQVLASYNAALSRLDVMAQMSVTLNEVETETLSAQVGNVNLVNWEGMLPHFRLQDINLLAIYQANLWTKSGEVLRQSPCYHQCTWTTAAEVPLYLLSEKFKAESLIFGLFNDTYAMIPSNEAPSQAPAATDVPAPVDEAAPPVEQVEIPFEAEAPAVAPASDELGVQ